MPLDQMIMGDTEVNHFPNNIFGLFFVKNIHIFYTYKTCINNFVANKIGLCHMTHYLAYMGQKNMET